MVVIFVLMTFVGVLLFFQIRLWLRERAHKVTLVNQNIGIAAHAIPSGYRLSGNHLWIQELASGATRIGVDELLQRFIGVPDRIELKSPGHVITQGESLAVVERDGKKLHIRAPFDAQVSRTNFDLVECPSAVSSDPYRMGWLYQLTMLDSSKSYKGSRKGYDAVKWLSDEFFGLRDFIQKYLTRPEPVSLTLADGGDLQPGLMDHLDQDEILEFETAFLAGDRK